MSVQTLHDLLLAGLAVYRGDAPGAVVMNRPTLEAMLRELAAGDGWGEGHPVLEDIGNGEYLSSGLPVYIDDDCPGAVVMDADQVTAWRAWSAEKRLGRMFPPWDS